MPAIPGMPAIPVHTTPSWAPPAAGTSPPTHRLNDALNAGTYVAVGLGVLRVFLAILRLHLRKRMNRKIADAAYMSRDEADAIFDGRHVEFTLTEVQRLTCARRVLNFFVGVRDIINVLKKLPVLGTLFTAIFGLIEGLIGTALSPIILLASTILQGLPSFGDGSTLASAANAAKDFASAKGQAMKSKALSGESFEKVVMIEAKDESGQVLATYIVNDGRHWLQRSQKWEEGAYLTIRRLSAGEKGPVLLRTHQRYRCCCDVRDVGPTMFFMLLANPAPFWYELRTANGEVYAKMPVSKACKDACCSLCTKRTYRMRGASKDTERVNIQIASCPGCCNGEEGSTVWPSERPKAPSNRFVAQAHLPQLHELLSEATSMAEGTELFAPLEAATSIAQAQDKLTDDKIYDLTNRDLYKKMSGPTKACSIKAPPALSVQQKSSLILFAIEKFFFAKDLVEQFG
jgi:hypothetical protein